MDDDISNHHDDKDDDDDDDDGFYICRYSEWIDECERVNNPEDDGA